MEKVYRLLEDGHPAREFQPTNEYEHKVLSNFQFLTAKAQVVVFNVGEDDLGPGGRAEALTAKHPGSIALSASLEMDISQLPKEEQQAFLEELGIAVPATAQLANAAYAILDTIPFFTVSEEECRTWTMRRGSTAHDAAGKVHTDLARGFVRAEVFTFEELMEAGDEKRLKALGKIRLEGRDYQVQDGDVVYIRANTR